MSKVASQNTRNAIWFLDRLSARFPEAKIELNYDARDPWQLLVAVVLSAQATDKKVNEITPALFKAFKNVEAFAKATPSEVEPYVHSLGFFRNKSKNIVGAARMLAQQFGGRLPRERALLEQLPGVGAKSAAVIVANAFGEPAIAVDTHVGRVARRLGLTKETDPSKVEATLTALLPKERLIDAHHVFIWHGRRICFARKPACSTCPVNERCPRVGVKSFS
jgi:endonuclease-3